MIKSVLLGTPRRKSARDCPCEQLLTLVTSSYGKGPLKIGVTDTVYSDITDFFDAFEGTGNAHAARDGNNGEAYGTSWYPNTMNPRTGERTHARNSYYDPIMSRSNLKVILESLATELVFDGNKTLTAKGVKITDKKTGSTKTYYAKQEVILAAVSKMSSCLQNCTYTDLIFSLPGCRKHTKASPEQRHRTKSRTRGCWHHRKA